MLTQLVMLKLRDAIMRFQLVMLNLRYGIM